MFYVGGDCGNSNIELHDVRFSVGETAKDCYDDLRAQWWGTKESLHIDSWSEIDQVDGYAVTLSAEPFKGKEKLYFLNLGGYSAPEFEEVHKNVLMVDTSQRNVIQRAIQAVRTTWILPHKDAIADVEKVVSVSKYTAERNLNIHLQKIENTDEHRPFQFTLRYIRLHRFKSE